MEAKNRLRSSNSSKSDSRGIHNDGIVPHSDLSNSSDKSSKRSGESVEYDKQNYLAEGDEDMSSKQLQLKMLSYGGTGPGKFMEDFDPERSSREMRKMHRRIYRENVRKNQMYDETGRLFENSKDLCDCLEVDCPGCHFPCTKCGSEKCGTECRCNRKWVYDSVEVEGTDIVIQWSS